LARGAEARSRRYSGKHSLGIDAIRPVDFADAETLLRKALERAQQTIHRLKKEKRNYYLGLALKAQDKLDDSYTQLYKSTWSYAWRSVRLLRIGGGRIRTRTILMAP